MLQQLWYLFKQNYLEGTFSFNPYKMVSLEILMWYVMLSDIMVNNRKEQSEAQLRD